MVDATQSPAPVDRHVALVEMVNRVVDRGVVLSGDLTISVAEIDLLHVGLRLVLSSAQMIEERTEVRAGTEIEITRLGVDAGGRT